MNIDGEIACFGEILIGMASPDGELLLQSPRLEVRFGGAEANVAALLSQLGPAARMISFVPDNPLGRAARAELRRHGVDVGQVRFAPGRQGFYFLTPGAVLRPSEVLYDREASAFALANPSAIDWRDALRNVGLLHLSGVTPALGAWPAEASLRAVQTARETGVQVSFDGNYRAKLWAGWDGDAPARLAKLLSFADVAFIDDRDVALVLGRTWTATDPLDRRREAAQAAFAAFPRLERIACTVRTPRSVDHHDMSAVMFARSGRETVTDTVPLSGIVDRIGAGDAFVGGLLHGFRSGIEEPAALAFGLAAACLKHSIRGDVLVASESEVAAACAGGGLDVRR